MPSPPEIARLVETRGIAKSRTPAMVTFVLGLVAGAFIALGAVLSTTVATGSTLGLGPTRWLAGIAFSLGLILVVIAGAELFTGNNLIVMSVVSGHVSPTRLLRQWAIVYVGNATVRFPSSRWSRSRDWWRIGDAEVGVTALSIAATKTSLSFPVVLARGVLANALVCLAVWLAAGGRSMFDKILRSCPRWPRSWQRGSNTASRTCSSSRWASCSGDGRPCWPPPTSRRRSSRRSTSAER